MKKFISNISLVISFALLGFMMFVLTTMKWLGTISANDAALLYLILTAVIIILLFVSETTDRQKKVVIYFDLDGVLNEFEEATPEEIDAPGFCLSRRPQWKAIELLLFLWNEGYDVRILTATYQNGYAEAEKRQWVKHYGMRSIPVICVPYGDDKFHYVDKDCLNILIDDYSHNLFKWESQKDCVAIKWRNSINGTTGSWKRFGGRVLKNYWSLQHIFNTCEDYIAEISLQAHKATGQTPDVIQAK